MIGAYEMSALLLLTFFSAIAPAFGIIYFVYWLFPAFPGFIFSLDVLIFFFTAPVVLIAGVGAMFVYCDFAFCRSTRTFGWIFDRFARRNAAEFEQQELKQRGQRIHRAPEDRREQGGVKVHNVFQ